jgi:transposase-like protein
MMMSSMNGQESDATGNVPSLVLDVMADGLSDTSSCSEDLIADPEMAESGSRRPYSRAYKLSLIEQADACVHHGDLAALLRREGLYHSTLRKFRSQKAQGLLDGTPPRQVRAALTAEVAAGVRKQLDLERENRKLRRQLAQAERIIAIQKKAAILLGETLQDLEITDADD